MFGLFKSDPVRKLEKEYALKLKQAQDLQRNGDIVEYSQLATEADDILSHIEELERQRHAG